MPKAPILSREGFFTTLRDGSIRDLDWNLVNTNLGAMMEPRQLSIVGSPVTDVDPNDYSYTRRVQLDENTLPETLGTAGPQLPYDFNAP